MRRMILCAALLLALLTGLAWGYTTFLKDPDATLDYTVDWSDWLDPNDTISASAWSVPSGLTQVSASYTTTSATIWLSGGTAGSRYAVVNRISTAAGRTEDRSFVVVCQER